MSAPGAPALAGQVEHAAEHELVLRLDEPAPGHALVAVYDGGDGPLVNVHAWLYGPRAEDTAAPERVAWQAWMDDRFPHRSAVAR